MAKKRLYGNLRGQISKALGNQKNAKRKIKKKLRNEEFEDVKSSFEWAFKLGELVEDKMRGGYHIIVDVREGDFRFRRRKEGKAYRLFPGTGYGYVSGAELKHP